MPCSCYTWADPALRPAGDALILLAEDERGLLPNSGKLNAAAAALYVASTADDFANDFITSRADTSLEQGASFLASRRDLSSKCSRGRLSSATAQAQRLGSKAAQGARGLEALEHARQQLLSQVSGYKGSRSAGAGSSLSFTGEGSFISRVEEQVGPASGDASGRSFAAGGGGGCVPGARALPGDDDALEDEKEDDTEGQQGKAGGGSGAASSRDSQHCSAARPQVADASGPPAAAPPSLAAVPQGQRPGVSPTDSDSKPVHWWDRVLAGKGSRDLPHNLAHTVQGPSLGSAAAFRGPSRCTGGGGGARSMGYGQASSGLPDGADADVASEHTDSPAASTSAPFGGRFLICGWRRDMVGARLRLFVCVTRTCCHWQSGRLVSGTLSVLP